MNSLHSIYSVETLDSLLADNKYNQKENNNENVLNSPKKLRDFGKEMLLWSDTDTEKGLSLETPTKWADFDTTSIESGEKVKMEQEYLNFTNENVGGGPKIIEEMHVFTNSENDVKTEKYIKTEIFTREVVDENSNFRTSTSSDDNKSVKSSKSSKSVRSTTSEKVVPLRWFSIENINNIDDDDSDEENGENGVNKLTQKEFNPSFEDLFVLLPTAGELSGVYE